MAGTIEKPTLARSMLELRAPLEILSLIPTLPWLRRHAPTGDGQPVMVFPGFLATDRGTYILRRFLSRQGFSPYAWDIGINPGLQEIIYRRLETRLKELAETHGQSVSLVGWSLGGVYARTLAHKHPKLVRQVITLGSPFNLSHDMHAEDIAVSSPIMKMYERLNPRLKEDRLINGDPVWRKAPPVPSTAIYSESDGITSWQYCIDQQPGSRNENLCVPGSHTGLTHNPWVLYLLAERLAQPEGEWQHFRNSWLHRLCLINQPDAVAA